MKNDIQKLRDLVDTYKLSRPVSPEVQKYVIRSRTPDLRHILKKSGKYGLISWLVIMIFMLFRKYGLHITMIQSKIIAGITAAAVASGSAAVTYKGAKYILEAAGRPAPHVEETIDTPVAPVQQKQTEKQQPIPVYKEKTIPAGKKLPDSKKEEKVKKKKEPEHSTISDIPNL